MKGTEIFSCFVPGTPRPQGSKSIGKNGRMYESSKYLPGWRRKITQVASMNRPPRPLNEPLDCHYEFIMPRPKSLGTSGYKPHQGKPDSDKLVRPINDSLKVARVIRDDSIICAGSYYKRYAFYGELPGVEIHLYAFITPEEERESS